LKLKERILNRLRRFYREKKALDKGLLKSLDLVNISVSDYNKLIFEAISKGRPLMVSRFGSAELNWYLNYKILRKSFIKRAISYITLEIDELDKNRKFISDITFLPESKEATSNYMAEIDSIIPKIDIIGTWLRQEQSKELKYNKDTKFIYLGHLEPYYSDNPWSFALKGKKVLVIHPMKKSIESQYLKRDLLFKNKNILPEFKLNVLQAPYFDDPRFGSWKLIMDFYKSEVVKYDFDVAILGCGSWGMPLAGFIKNLGKVAIHLGGSTQLLFGIIGERWETQWPEFQELNLVNSNWTRPLPEETPTWAKGYDRNSYW
jgi:hypothetical protein